MSHDLTKVLLVEDNPGDARLLRELLLEPHGSPFEVVHVTRLSEALRRLGSDSFSIILLDLSLPDSQGLDTISRLRSHADNVPVVVLTGLDNEEIAVQSVEQGAQDYLVKGQVDGHLLARSLRYAVQRHRAEQTLKQRHRELLILRKISETIIGSLDLKSITESILKEAMGSGSFDLGNIRLVDRSGEVIGVAVSSGYRDPKNVLRHRKLSRSSAVGQSRFGSRMFNEPCIEENVQTCVGLRTLKREGVASFIEVPILAKGEFLGVIQLASRTPRTFKPDEINLLTTIGNQVGAAVQKAQLYEETKCQAIELEMAKQMQADFTAMIAHDLRSPMMNIMGAADMMMEGMLGSINEEQKRWLSVILESSRGMVDLVSDFLDISKIEASDVKINKEAVDFQVLIGRCLEHHLMLARKKGVSLSNQADPALVSIEGDARRLEQVLGNLISNAIKFTNQGGAIEIGAARQNGHEVNVWVKDNGVGIAPEDLGLLFEKYRQGANQDNASFKGTGLGLVICKMIVEAHGGKIWAESEAGKGTTISFSLPSSTELSGGNGGSPSE
jgi:signal transduction histidine kinase/DNA-binding response OmpR family regulator